MGHVVRKLVEICKLCKVDVADAKTATAEQLLVLESFSKKEPGTCPPALLKLLEEAEKLGYATGNWTVEVDIPILLTVLQESDLSVCEIVVAGSCVASTGTAQSGNAQSEVPAGVSAAGKGKSKSTQQSKDVEAATLFADSELDGVCGFIAGVKAKKELWELAELLQPLALSKGQSLPLLELFQQLGKHGWTGFDFGPDTSLVSLLGIVCEVEGLYQASKKHWNKLRYLPMAGCTQVELDAVKCLVDACLDEKSEKLDVTEYAKVVQPHVVVLQNLALLDPPPTVVITRLLEDLKCLGWEQSCSSFAAGFHRIKLKTLASKLSKSLLAVKVKPAVKVKQATQPGVPIPINVDDRRRKVNPQWLSDFKWLRHVDGILYCAPCSIVQGKFVTFKKKRDQLVKHVGPEHEKRVAKAKGIEEAEAISQLKQGHVRQQLSVGCDAFKAKKLEQFAIVFHVLRGNRPMLEYERMFEMLDFLGVDVSAHHRSYTAGWDIANSLRQVCTGMMQSAVAASELYSFSVDESSACDRREMISMVVYTLNKCFQRQAWHVYMHHLPDSTAIGITDMILRLIKNELKACPSKAVGFGSDGASVFQGALNGVCKKLKTESSPFCITIHCTSHRVQLVSHTVKSVREYQCLEQLCHSVYNYFARSNKRTDELRDWCDFLDVKYLSLGLECEVRFLSIQGALSKLWHNLFPVLAKVHEDMTNTMHPDACFIVESFGDLDTLLFCAIVMPLFTELNVLVKYLQGREVYLFDVALAVQACKDTLAREYAACSLESFEEYLKLKAVCMAGPLQGMDDRDVAGLTWIGSILHLVLTKDVTIEMTAKPQNVRGRKRSEAVDTLFAREVVQRVEESAKALVQKVLDDFESRFPPCEVLQSLAVVDPRYWLGNMFDMSSFATLMDVLIKQFGVDHKTSDGTVIPALLCGKSLKAQAPSFISHMQGLQEGITSSILWSRVASSDVLSARYSEWLIVARISLLVPIGSVENEREFSLLNLLKSDRRNRLAGDNLNACMSIATIPAGLTGFDFEQAYSHWFSSKNRRFIEGST